MRYQTALTATLILVVALLIARPAAADPVGMQQLGAGLSAKLASGFLTSSERGNIKETWTLTPHLRWGNDYMHQRYYSPILGRFISVDPVMGDTACSQSYNRYSYVENNPVRLVDPDGMDPGDVFGTADDAALDAFSYIVRTQEGTHSQEWGAWLYETQKGQFSYLDPFTDHDPIRVNPLHGSRPDNWVTFFHTHTHGSGAASEEDRASAAILGTPTFTGVVETGQMYRWEPEVTSTHTLTSGNLVPVQTARNSEGEIAVTNPANPPLRGAESDKAWRQRKIREMAAARRAKASGEK